MNKKGAKGAKKSPTKDELRDYAIKHCGGVYYQSLFTKMKMLKSSRTANG